LAKGGRLDPYSNIFTFAKMGFCEGGEPGTISFLQLIKRSIEIRQAEKIEVVSLLNEKF